MQFDLTFGLSNLAVAAEVYANIPFVGRVQMAKGSGSLECGVTVYF
ncbi:hypothetical protein ID866_6783, partial [Astraeus odoratus]